MCLNGVDVGNESYFRQSEGWLMCGADAITPYDFRKKIGTSGSFDKFLR